MAVGVADGGSRVALSQALSSGLAVDDVVGSTVASEVGALQEFNQRPPKDRIQQ